MRAFVVMCFVALASADKLGYNYQPVAHSDSGLSFSPGGHGGLSGGSAGGLGGLSGGSAGGLGGLSGGSVGGLGGYSGGLGSLGGAIGGGSSGGLGGIGVLGGIGGSLGGLGDLSGGSSGSLGGSSSGSLSSLGSSSGIDSGSSSSGSSSGSDVEYEKEFYTYTADDSAFDEPEANQQVSYSAKKNLRVIFIKGPENNALEKAVVNLAKHASEQRTAIYVLQKQASVSDLANKLQASHDVHNHQPEVHFVKYRTPEDAANAQKAIQAQYDQLGGSSQSHNGGVAPVHNFASPASSGGNGGVSGGSSGGISGGASDGLSGGSSGGVSGGISGGSSGGIVQIGGVSGGSGHGSLSATYLPAAILRV
ncbi:uncharacterized protein LOC105220413 [Zeugodacus cucurbitae]|nr:uncharacterized protein LOC105220413 [Zeugodacus cucurbitae]